MNTAPEQELEKKIEIASGDEVITKGSMWAAIWHMSWPLFVNMVTIAVASFADVYVAGRLGSDTQAAIGICGQIWFFMVILAVALSAGANAMVSRFWGAREYDQAIEAARQSLIFAFFFGVASCAVGLACCRPIMRVLGASPVVEELGWQFMQYDMLAQLPFTMLWVFNSIFRARGSARVPMLIWGMMTTTIIIAEVGLCLWPLHVGIAGIGIAWLIAGSLGVALSVWIMRRGELKDCIDFAHIFKHGMSAEWFWRLMKIGVPACVQDLAWVGGNFVLFLIFAKAANPTACQAAWSVGMRIEEMIGGFPIYALSMAVATIVGQNLGANQPERAERAGWQVTAVGAGINMVVALALFLGSGIFAGWMSNDPLVITYSRSYLEIVGLSLPFVAIWLILVGAMQGAGYTKWPMIVSAICLSGIRLPLAWYLTVPQHMGPAGAWIAIALSSTAVGVCMIWRFKTGVWKTQKV